MPDTKVSALTAASALTGTESLAGVQSSASRRITPNQIKTFIADRAIIRAAADRTLTSNTSAQAIFNAPTNGRLTLTIGTYLIRGLIHINTMSATSGNAQFGLLGAGSAVLADQLLHLVGVDGAAATAAAQSGSTIQGGNTSPASAVTAGTGTAMTLNIVGSFECTTAGTIVPSVTLVTANAAVVKVGSFLVIERVSDLATFTNVAGVFGGWD